MATLAALEELLDSPVPGSPSNTASPALSNEDMDMLPETLPHELSTAPGYQSLADSCSCGVGEVTSGTVPPSYSLQPPSYSSPQASPRTRSVQVRLAALQSESSGLDKYYHVIHEQLALVEGLLAQERAACKARRETPLAAPHIRASPCAAPRSSRQIQSPLATQEGGCSCSSSQVPGAHTLKQHVDGDGCFSKLHRKSMLGEDELLAAEIEALDAIIRARHEEVGQASNEVEALLAFRRSQHHPPSPTLSSSNVTGASPATLELRLREAWKRNLEMTRASGQLSEEVTRNAHALDLLYDESESLREQLDILAAHVEQVAHGVSCK
mmetsp:Transcript_1497/g.3215  ORF Transcript_1497/g.3215 Transcript_1497/m.3215 type:complete len:326 (-) Transcript_1497:54-1031(-)